MYGTSLCSSWSWQLFFLHFFLLSLQRSLKVRNWMLQKLLSLKLLRNRSYRQCLRRSMKPSNSLQEALNGTLTVSFVFAILSCVDSWEFAGAIWNSEISSSNGGLKLGIYSRSCSEGHFQMCHSTLLLVLCLKFQFGVFSESIQVWWLCSEVHVPANWSFVLLNWLVETGK